MLPRIRISLVLLLLLVSTSLCAQTSYTTKTIPESGITEITFSNGIKVALRPMEKSDDILVHAIAAGGYSFLPPDQQASGKLAAEIATDSGFGPWTGNDVANKLLEDSLELQLGLTATYRYIEAGAPNSQLHELLYMFHQLYTAPRFDQAIVPSVVSRLGESVMLRHQDAETLFEDVTRAANTGADPLLNPISEQDLKNLNFDVAKRYYLEDFLSTDGLTLLIVGEFTLDQAIPLITRWIATIPRKERAHQTNLSPYKSLPEGITVQEVVSPYLHECLHRMTFPLTMEMNEQTAQLLEISSQVIETRLRECFRKVLGSTQGVDIAYEFPYYPYTDAAWLTVQYRAPGSKSKTLEKIILAEIRKLQETGPTVEEIEKVRKQQSRNDEFWITHKRYWIMLLSNHYLWNWDVRYAIKDFDNSKYHKPEVVRDFLKAYLPSTCYTMLLLKPK